jgi:hypothetical protein
VKKLVAIIFLFIFSFQYFYTVVVNCWFYANRSSITLKYCINKSRPKLKCNGNCYLSKQLKKAEENEEKEAPKQLKKLAETSPCTIATFNYNLQSPSEISIRNPKIEGNYHFTRYTVVFHPPSLSFS